jgi:anaerobic selenocysteine-containing dehydrogenase
LGEKNIMGRKTEDIGKPKIVKTICNMCSNHCGLNAYLENGKIVKVDGMQEHPFHNLCIKPYAIPEWVHSSERLTNPLKKENGKFKEISWDEAFDFVADRLSSIKKDYGPEAVVTHLGGPVCIGPMIKSVLRRFSDLYGTPNYTSGAFVCFLARVIGSILTCGTFPNPDLCFTGTNCILVWGKNPPESFASERDAIS